jgi:carbon-monoxide dehydrogenase medium subunit
VKPAPFEFHAPETEEEIRGLMAEHGEEARPLAGGQSLVPLMNMRILRPSVLIALNRCGALDYLREDGDVIACGALTRQATAEDSELVRTRLPLLAAALPHIGVRATRNFGTVCGSLAHGDPIAELPSVAAALEARFVIASRDGTREVAAEDFFVSALTTCMNPDEMLREVRFPTAAATARNVFLEVANRAHGFAVAGLAASVELAEDGHCRRARLAAMGMGTTTLRLAAAEALLEGQHVGPELVAEAAAAAVRSVDPHTDLHASSGYRRQLAGVLVRRALGRAMAPAP